MCIIEIALLGAGLLGGARYRNVIKKKLGFSCKKSEKLLSANKPSTVLCEMLALQMLRDFKEFDTPRVFKTYHHKTCSVEYHIGSSSYGSYEYDHHKYNISILWVRNDKLAITVDDQEEAILKAAIWKSFVLCSKHKSNEKEESRQRRSLLALESILGIEKKEEEEAPPPPSEELKGGITHLPDGRIRLDWIR